MQNAPRHVIVVNPTLRGAQYGMLRDLEAEICRLTGAEILPVPPRRLGGRLAHGTRYAGLRALVPRRPMPVAADVLWAVLMGPEDFQLDVYRGWDRGAGCRILYLFDTFEAQLPALRRVLAACAWDLVVTSFASAVPALTRWTGRTWHAVPQGVRLARFWPGRQDPAARPIQFSAYGRRLADVHDGVRAYCAAAGHYYDYNVAALTAAGGVAADLTPTDLYDQYTWHLRHSQLTFSWPVELTTPQRSPHFSPITCRWFEAAAAGTVVVGAPPADETFAGLFGDGAVIDLRACRTPALLAARLPELVAAAPELLEQAARRRERLAAGWTWESRVRALLALAGLTVRGELAP